MAIRCLGFGIGLNATIGLTSCRRRETSVRTAPGAGRGRIVRQLLTERVVLGLISVPLGIVLAAVGTKLIASGMPPDQVPYCVRWELDWRSVAGLPVEGGWAARSAMRRPRSSDRSRAPCTSYRQLAIAPVVWRQTL